MKTLALLLLSAGVLICSAGCMPTSSAYSGGFATVKPIPEPNTGEHANRILRNWGLEQMQAVDDIDSVLLLDPPSRLTGKNVR